MGPGIRFGCYSLDEIGLDGMLSCRPDLGSFVPVLMESHTLEMQTHHAAFETSYRRPMIILEDRKPYLSCRWF